MNIKYLISIKKGKNQLNTEASIQVCCYLNLLFDFSSSAV